MNRSLVAVTLAILLFAGGQASVAIVAPSLSTRDENRQIILAAEGSAYNPYRMVEVTRGTPGNLVTVSVPAWQGLEMQLDDLDKDSISLGALQHIVDSQQGGDSPMWPLYGRFKFTEKGYIAMGATCPTIQPAQVWGAQTQANNLNATQDVNHTLGNLTTSVSEYWRNGTSTTQQQSSFLSYWNLSNTNVSGTNATKSWGYGKATAEGWTIFVEGHIDYFCLKGASLIFHQSAADPHANRTDAPGGAA